MYQTPPWLQSSTSACGSANGAYTMPSNLQEWGAIAAQYIQHMDTKFPGVVTDYEIWNEPNTISLCVPAASRLADYINLYSVAAPMMRAQIQADHSNARVGGPATAGLSSSWVNALLSNSITSQNIDFLSYHSYLFSGKQTAAEWNTYNNMVSIYQETQNSGNGPLATFEFAEKLVAAGKQPQGKNLPVYNTEYNLNWSYLKNCCQNDYTYSPVWNGMFVADMLNGVYAGTANTVSHMIYFGATAHPYFCLIGELDANMDCTLPTTGQASPYPQYFLYQLFGSPTYLGLQNGGYMANTISPATYGNGLLVTAFYTSGQDAIVLINPSQYTYNGLPVLVTNTGFSSASATLYNIANGQSIRSSPLSVSYTHLTLPTI